MKNNSPFSFREPEESPGYLLWQLTMLWQRKMKAGLDQLDLTHTQFVLLAALQWLSQQQETVTQKDIAAHANVDKMMTSKVIRTLQEKGLISRQEHETDTRAKTVVITGAGLALLEEALRIVESVDNRFFGAPEDNGRSFTQIALKLLGQDQSKLPANE
jgi:DNA-binding MarR family transcriptional regulator